MATAFATAESFSPPSRPMQFNIDVEAAAVAGAEMLMKRRLAYQRNEIAFYRPWVFRFGLEATIESVSEAARYIVSGETMRSYTFRAEGLKAADLETLARDLEIPIGSLWEVAVTNWLSS